MTKEKKPAPLTKRSHKLLAICIAATIALTVFDLWTKDVALENLSVAPIGDARPVCEADERGYMYPQRSASTPYTLIEGNLEFHYAENCGAAFGMLREASSMVRHAVFGIAAVAATFALLWMFWSGRGGAPFAWAVPFIVSGALGNLADRLRFGYVVDFIRFYWSEPIPLLGTQWPTFNVADITITVGVVLLVIDGWQEGKREKERAAAEKKSAEPAAA